MPIGIGVFVSLQSLNKLKCTKYKEKLQESYAPASTSVAFAVLSGKCGKCEISQYVKVTFSRRRAHLQH